MILYPAIDLKDGACVRLKLGDMNAATVYNADPAAQARTFRDIGFPWLHVVDLNGAFAGRSVNGAAVDAILEAVAPSMRVQLGGGIRDMAAIEAWLDKGISRVILGTVALRDPDLVKAAAKAFPGRVVVGIDGHRHIPGDRSTRLGHPEYDPVQHFRAADQQRPTICRRRLRIAGLRQVPRRRHDRQRQRRQGIHRIDRRQGHRQDLF